MKKENLAELEYEMCSCVKKIKELEPYIEEDEAMRTLYNQAIVDKAVLINKIEKFYKRDNFFKNLVKGFRIAKSKKLICDYFMK